MTLDGRTTCHGGRDLDGALLVITEGEPELHPRLSVPLEGNDILGIDGGRPSARVDSRLQDDTLGLYLHSFYTSDNQEIVLVQGRRAIIGLQSSILACVSPVQATQLGA